MIQSKKSATFWNHTLISVKQLAPDQHPPDLARAGADLIELGVSQLAARRVIVDIAIAAKKLDRIKCRPCRVLSRKQQGTRRILARGAAIIAGASHRMNIGPARIQASVHISELALYKLELSDRMAELLALARIGQTNIETGLHDAERSGREYEPLLLRLGDTPGVNLREEVR